MNSLFHGFDEGDAGTISMDFSIQEDQLKVVYNDDGKGMPQEVVEKIYKPFFTSKKGKGGTGLGMHIVSTQVQEVLGGTIDCDSIIGEGTTFTIQFPVEWRIPK